MKTLTRRETISILTGSLLTVTVTGICATADESASQLLNGGIFNSILRAESADDTRVGTGADLASLLDRINSFFGVAEGRYLSDQIIYQDTASPGWDINSRRIYDQFVSVFKGAPEMEATLSNGVRMVVRFYSEYKAIVFLDEQGNIVNAAMTFDFCPPNGVKQIIDGRSVQTKCLWPFSAVLFSKGTKPNQAIADALGKYLESLPLELERADARRMSADGKIKVKIFSRKL